MCDVTHCDGRVVVARAGDGAVRDDLLVQRRRAALGLGLRAALGQVVVVDLVLFDGNLFAEPEGARRQRHSSERHSSLLLSPSCTRLCAKLCSNAVHKYLLSNICDLLDFWFQMCWICAKTLQ